MRPAEGSSSTSFYRRPGFRTEYEEIPKAFHLSNEAGRRLFINLFLRDVILREEFGGALRIFTEVGLWAVSTEGAKRRRLGGRTDYTIGAGIKLSQNIASDLYGLDPDQIMIATSDWPSFDCGKMLGDEYCYGVQQWKHYTDNISNDSIPR